MNHPNASVQTPATLDALAKSLGSPTAAMTRFAFRGADEEWMLRQGQSTASESILADGAAFVRSTGAIWSGLSSEKRAKVLGYNPALDAVIVRELIVLRAASHQYDLAAQASSESLGQRRQAAADALADGITLRLAVFQTVRDLLGSAHPIGVGLDAAMKPAETMDVVANGLDKIADTLRAMRHGDKQRKPDAELVEDLDAAQLNDELVASMHDDAQKMRDTDALAAARPQDLAAAQRALDLQDGRVLHVIGVVLRAFRRVRRADGAMLVPDLGKLSRNFGGGRKSPSGDDEDPQPEPAPTPAPVN